jgi:segregation and condensation protein A
MDMIESIDESAKKSDQGSYVLSIDNFDGPLDLLWNLIKEAKLDITEISISQITEQYINYLKLMDELNIQVASEFILMASELLYYKTKALLPGDELDDEYFVPQLPPDLIQKLLEYKKYQAAAAVLRNNFDSQADSFTRNNIQAEFVGDEIYIEVTLYDLLNAFSQVVESLVTIEQNEIIFDEILVSDMIERATKLLSEREQILYTELLTARPSRSMIVAAFLAILEMTKTRKIKIMQHAIYGDIRLFRVFVPGV